MKILILSLCIIALIGYLAYRYASKIIDGIDFKFDDDDLSGLI